MVVQSTRRIDEDQVSQPPASTGTGVHVAALVADGGLAVAVAAIVALA